MTAPVLDLVDVHKHYTLGSRRLEVLKGVSVRVERGEHVLVIGPSGSGKSTLLNIIGTLDRPASGEVCLAGEDVSNLPDDDLSRIRREEIGFIFQLHHLLPQCTVLENVLIPTLAGGGDADASASDRARTLLQRVGLGDHLDKRPGQLSGGECQRTAVVRALINKPRLLLADEPTGSLDENTADELGSLLVELNREENIALIVVTHSADLARRMGKIYRLHSGKLDSDPSTGKHG